MTNVLIRKLRSLHANQSGAVAFMVLCAILICLMLALVIYDTTPVARQKLEVQTAADTAAWSQSAVESRAMNMISFANIGKRMVIGQTLFYESLWAAWGAILAIAVVATIVACALCIIGIGCPFCEKLVELDIELGDIMLSEATDLASFLGEIKDYAKEDVESFDKYQVYFQKLTPWWAWGEQYRRGMRNGAIATAAWPVPRNALSLLPSVPLVGTVGTGLEDSLPIKRYDDYGDLCVRSFVPDLLPGHAADYALQTTLCGNSCVGGITSLPSPATRIALYALAGVFAVGIYGINCLTERGGAGFVTATFGSGNHPFGLKDPSNDADWLQMTSNVVFAYRPGREFSTDFRKKYSYLSADYDHALPFIYEADGFLGIARSEISFQDGAPDMWHPSWSARMRPLALPGEWAGYSGGYRLVSAFHDTIPYLMAGSFLGLLGGGMGTPDPKDLLKAEMAIDSMNNEFIDGVAR